MAVVVLHVGFDCFTGIQLGNPERQRTRRGPGANRSLTDLGYSGHGWSGALSKRFACLSCCRA